MDKTKSLGDILAGFGNPLEEQNLLLVGLNEMAKMFVATEKDNNNDNKEQKLL